MSLVRSLDIHAISSSLPAQSALPSHAFSIEMNLSEPEQKKNLVFTILMAGRCTDKQQTERIFVICIAVLDLAVKVIKKKDCHIVRSITTGEKGQITEKVEWQ